MKIFYISTFFCCLALATLYGLDDMIDVPYSFPKHSICEQNGQYKIHFSLKNHWNKFNTLTPQQKNAVLIQKAKKSPLIAMAFIHKMAQRGDAEAQQIADLYAHYQHFLESQDLTTFRDFAKQDNEVGRYVSDLLAGSIPQESDTKTLIENLIPSFKETLFSPKVTLDSAEQVVRVSEMSCAYNAFPDLIKYKGFYYLSFREAGKHQGENDLGNARILKGQYLNGKWNWQNEALLSSEIYDLRDPKFFIDGNNTLRLILGGSIIGKKGTKQMVPHVATLVNEKWDLVKAKVNPEAPPLGQWIWQVSWNKNENAGYGFSYGINDYGMLHLMKTRDGTSFEKVTEITLRPENKELNLTEATIRFKEDNTALSLIRADSKTLIGTSPSPYQKWTLNEVPFHGGGHNFVFMGNKTIATTRYLFLKPDNIVEERMLIALLDHNSLIPIKTLNSQFDTGYAGIVVENEQTLTIAYYSCSSPDSSDIYIVRINIDSK